MRKSYNYEVILIFFQLPVVYPDPDWDLWLDPDSIEYGFEKLPDGLELLFVYNNAEI